jgi:hypothetical protein
MTIWILTLVLVIGGKDSAHKDVHITTFAVESACRAAADAANSWTPADEIQARNQIVVAYTCDKTEIK